jgi:hypothetical protein
MRQGEGKTANFHSALLLHTMLQLNLILGTSKCVQLFLNAGICFVIIALRSGDVHLSSRSGLAQWCIRRTMPRRHMGAAVLPARIRQQIHKYIPCDFVYCIMLEPKEECNQSVRSAFFQIYVCEKMRSLNQ